MAPQEAGLPSAWLNTAGSSSTHETTALAGQSEGDPAQLLGKQGLAHPFIP